MVIHLHASKRALCQRHLHDSVLADGGVVSKHRTTQLGIAQFVVAPIEISLSVIIDKHSWVDVATRTRVNQWLSPCIPEGSRRSGAPSHTDVMSPVIRFGNANIPVVALPFLHALTCPAGSFSSPSECGAWHGNAMICPIHHIHRGIHPPPLHVVEVVHARHIHVLVAIHIQTVITFEHSRCRVSSVAMRHDRILSTKTTAQKIHSDGTKELLHEMN